MERNNWPQILAFGLVAMIVFLCGIGFLLLLFFSGTGMMGAGGMMGDWCPWGRGPGRIGGGFGIGPLELALILAVILLGGALIGAIAWVAIRSGRKPLAAEKCPQCGQPVQPDWLNCPHCGEPLKREEK